MLSTDQEKLFAEALRYWLQIEENIKVSDKIAPYLAQKIGEEDKILIEVSILGLEAVFDDKKYEENKNLFSAAEILEIIDQLRAIRLHEKPELDLLNLTAKVDPYLSPVTKDDVETYLKRCVKYRLVELRQKLDITSCKEEKLNLEKETRDFEESRLAKRNESIITKSYSLASTSMKEGERLTSGNFWHDAERHFDQALHVLNQFLIFDSKNTQASQLKVEALFEKGVCLCGKAQLKESIDFFKDAKKQLETILEVTPNNPAACYLQYKVSAFEKEVSLLQSQKKEFTLKSLVEFQQKLSDEWYGKAQKLYDEGQRLHTAQELKKAVDLFDEALSFLDMWTTDFRHPGTHLKARLIFCKALCLALQKKTEEAIKTLATMSEIDYASAQDDTHSSIIQLIKTLPENQTDPRLLRVQADVWYQKGWFYFDSKPYRPNIIMDCFKQVLIFEGKSSRALFAMATTACKTAKCLFQATKNKQNDPENIKKILANGEITCNYANGYLNQWLRMNEENEAARTLKVDIYFCKGTILFCKFGHSELNLELLEPPIEQFLNVLELKLTHVEALGLLLGALSLIGKNFSAYKKPDKAIEYFNKANIYLEKYLNIPDFQGEIDTLLSAKKMMHEILVLSGFSLFEQKKWEKSIAILTSALGNIAKGSNPELETKIQNAISKATESLQQENKTLSPRSKPSLFQEPEEKEKKSTNTNNERRLQ